jgi:hypothetical protein
MTNSTHSPSPWKAKPGNCGTLLGLLDANGEGIAMLGVAEALNPANIALIEAAPDLLAACKAAQSVMHALGIKADYLDDAIAKAKGAHSQDQEGAR